jgi:hypothetical protein
VAITYKSAMDDPNRIVKSKAAGALFASALAIDIPGWGP